MSNITFQIENVSKRYRIGLKEELHNTMIGALTSWIKYPLTNYKRLQKLSSFKDDEASDDIVWALRDVSFNVKQGEVVGIIGRNGAGKSTLLKILSRITNPTRGRIEVRGRVASLLEVGTGFHGELSGRENTFLNGTILGMTKSEIKRKFDEIVEFSGIGKFIDTPVKRYSSGMSVRLAFAIAAHLEPEILLIDEVLAVGDLQFQKKCIGKMENVANEGRTILFVSHNMPSIIKLCSRAILLNNGKVEADGKVSDVVQRYISIEQDISGEIVWHDIKRAPGNDIVRLRSVKIFQDGFNKPTSEVDISKEMQIRITYLNLVEGTMLYPAIWLKDRMGTPVLASSNGHSMNLIHDKWYGRPHPLGLFESVCRIPGNFLNDGYYSITVIIGKEPRTTQLKKEDILTFSVHETGEMRGEITAKGWLGVIRPKLAWSTEKI